MGTTVDQDEVKGNTCSVCGSPNARNTNVEGKGVNLCSEHAVDYQMWRPEHAPVEPDVEGYVRWKKRDEWERQHRA